jgi:UrcA family protein
MKRMIASALAAVALAGMVAPSALAERGQTVSVAVSYADLNLDSAAGAKTLLNRMQFAARKACGDTYSRSWTERHAAKACAEQAMADSVMRLNAPMVTAFFMDPKRAEMASR